MSEPAESLYITGSALPEGALPLVRITISLLPDAIDEQLGLVVGLEVGHPVAPRVINAAQAFKTLHMLLPALERKTRAEWVEHRKVCPVGDLGPEGEGE